MKTEKQIRNRNAMIRSVVVFIAVQIVFAVGYYLSGAELARCSNMCATFALSVCCGVLFAVLVTQID